MLNPHADRQTIIAFDNDALAWHGINEPVTSRVSHSVLTAINGIGVFRGVLSPGHHGGFASVHCGPGQFDLSGYAGLALRVRGDGKRYSLRLRTAATCDDANYEAEFAPDSGVWCDLRLPFTSFQPAYRGRTDTDHPPLDLAAIRTVGLIIAGRQEGPFSLELESIEGYRMSMTANHGGLTVVRNTERGRTDYRSGSTIAAGDLRENDMPVSRVSLFSNWMIND